MSRSIDRHRARKTRDLVYGSDLDIFGRNDLDIFGATYTDKDTVKRVQRALGIKVDGIIGPQTRGAVSTFNASHGAASDGSNITDATLAAVSQMESSGVSTGVTPSVPGPVPGGPIVVTPQGQLPLPSTSPLSALSQPFIGGLPLWQVMLGAVGLVAIGLGVKSALKKGPVTAS